MHENVLLVARAGLPALQGCPTACLGVLVEDEFVYAWFDGGPGAVLGCGMEFELLHRFYVCILFLVIGKLYVFCILWLTGSVTQMLQVWNTIYCLKSSNIEAFLQLRDRNE